MRTARAISRRTFLLGAAGIATLGLAACGGGGSSAATGAPSTAAATDIADLSQTPSEGKAVDDTGFAAGTHHATLVLKGYGTIQLELDADAAPVTVSNFARLANEGFYDGLTFHRIIKGFMMQGGDPKGDGTGGSDATIVGEFASNGHENPISHARGTISMARSNDPNSASSQFFIMQEDTPSLDGDYAAFGHVTEGMDVVDAVCDSARPSDSNGTIPKDRQPVIESLRMVD